MGIEPTRSRVNDPSTALKAADAEPQGVQPQALTQNTVDHCTNDCTNYGQECDGKNARTAPVPDDLAAVVAAWTDLPETVRARIVGLVEGATTVSTRRER